MPVRETNAAVTATIAISTTTSAAVSIIGVAVGGFVTPSALTGTAVSFQVSADGTTYVPLYDQTNALVSVTVSASRAYTLPRDWFAAWRYVKVVSNATELAARAVVLLTIPIS